MARANGRSQDEVDDSTSRLQRKMRESQEVDTAHVVVRAELVPTARPAQMERQLRAMQTEYDSRMVKVKDGEAAFLQKVPRTPSLTRACAYACARMGRRSHAACSNKRWPRAFDASRPSFLRRVRCPAQQSGAAQWRHADAKRMRALKKAEEERRMVEKKTTQIDELKVALSRRGPHNSDARVQAKLRTLESARDRLQRQYESIQPYEDYLKGVLSRMSYFADIEEVRPAAAAVILLAMVRRSRQLVNRYRIMREINDDLQQRTMLVRAPLPRAVA